MVKAKRFYRMWILFLKLRKIPHLEGIRKDVFLDRYSLKDEEGKSLEEYPEQMWRRVACGISQQEKLQFVRLGGKILSGNDRL